MLYLQLFADGVISGCAVGLVAISFAYFYAATGTFHVAHAGVYTASGYIAWFLTGIGISFLPAFAAAILGAAAIGCLIQFLLYQPLKDKKASPLVMMIASIGALTVLQNIAAVLFSPNIMQFDLGWRLHYADFGGISFSYPQIVIGVLSVVVFLGFLAFSQYTSLGKRIRAVASNPELAEITRLNPRVVLLYVISIASGIVAVPGVLIGVDQALQPYTSLLILLTAIVAMIAGGIGSIAGAFVMSILLGIIQSMSVALVPGRWSIAVVFGIFILFILIKPEGLFRRRFGRAI